MVANSVNQNINQQVMHPQQFNNGAQIPMAAQQFGTVGEYPDIINQTVQDSYMANRVKASQDSNPLAVAGVGTALWYGIAQAMDKINPMFEGEYAKSIIGKVGGAGDKFSKNTLVGRKLEDFFNWIGKNFNNLTEKSQIAYTLKNHSTRPEWGLAKNPGAGLHGFLAADTDEIFSKYIENIKTAQKLEQYGLEQSEIDKVAQAIKGKTKAEKALILQRKELEILGIKPDKIAKLEKKKGIAGLQDAARRLKVRKLGFKNLKHYEGLKGKFLDNPDEVMKVLEKGAKDNIRVSIWRGENKVKNHLVGRTCSASEYLNKYKATLGKGNDTYLGRFLAKAFGYLTEGCTNRFAGGKMMVAMQAFIFADMIVNAYKAPKGEKGKTIAERFVNDFTYFIALAVGIMGMHKVGGFKYAGLDKDGVSYYRGALKAFNEKVKAKAFASKEEYKAAKKELQELLGVKNIKNPITKLLHKVGSFINIGNERILSYRSTNKYNMNWMRKLCNGNIVGVPMRIIIPMMIVSPFMAKWATKSVHAIFGKPTNSVLDEGNETATKEVKQPEHGVASESFVNLLNQPPETAQLVPKQQSTNLLNMYKK